MWNFGGITRQSDLIICGQHKDGRHHEEVGAVIDKHGMDIEAIKEAVLYQNGCLFVFLHMASLREMSKTKVEVSKRKDYGERRVIRMEGEERKVALAKQWIKMKRNFKKVCS